MNEAEAKLLFNMQIDAMRTVLLAVEGIGMIQAEQAINEALVGVNDDATRRLEGAGMKLPLLETQLQHSR